MTDIISHWTFTDKQPREAQIKALKWIEENKDKKYFILQAPTGTGKSYLSLTASKFFAGNKLGNSFILTPQKILQEQYERDFSSCGDVFSLYGKANYKCASKNTSCNIGSLFKPVCSYCPHKVAKQKAQVNPNVVLNYKLALASFAYTETFEPRKLLVMDECHTLEQFLVDFDAIEVTYYSCKKFNVSTVNTTDITEFCKWVISKYLPAVEFYYSQLEQTVQYIKDLKSKPSAADQKVLMDYEVVGDLIDSLTTIKYTKEEDMINNFVLIKNDSSYTVKRITGVHSFRTILKNMASKFLFMSATILDYKAFCNDIGIDEKEATFLSLDSDFPEENRPIYYMPTMKMNAQWNSPGNASDRTQMVENINKLLTMHKDENGIIHTANFQVAQWLVKELSGKIPHQIFHHNPDTKDDRGAVIRAFLQNKKPSILISPSCSEGLDLKEDLGRFAIFAKIAFPFLGDQWILKRKDMSPEWYPRKTIIDVMQGCGRVVRSDTDVGYVYILDSSFTHLLHSTSNIIPKWWRKSIQTIN